MYISTYANNEKMEPKIKSDLRYKPIIHKINDKIMAMIPLFSSPLLNPTAPRMIPNNINNNGKTGEIKEITAQIMP